MRNFKNGLMAAAALTLGMAIALPGVNAAELSQPGQQLAQAKAKAAPAKKMTRAERDAQERAITKQLNEQQLKK